MVDFCMFALVFVLCYYCLHMIDLIILETLAATCAKFPYVSRNLTPSASRRRTGEFLINYATFPHACILRDVPTDSLSPPIESVLFSHQFPLTVHWQGPPNQSRFFPLSSTHNLYLISKYSVDVIISLPFTTIVHELVLLVDAKGYSVFDAPVLGVCVGNTLESVENFLATRRRASALPPLAQPLSSPPTATSGHASESALDAYDVGEWAVDMEGYPFTPPPSLPRTWVPNAGGVIDIMGAIN